MLVPFGNRILISVASVEKTEGGVILPDNYQASEPDMATVIAISPEADVKGRISVGSKVVVVRSLASKKQDSGDKHCIVDVDDILAVDE